MSAAARPASKAVRKALAHQQAGRLQDAKRLYLSVLQSEPSNATANHGLGLLSVMQGKVEAALPFLTTALQSDPKEPQHWLSFAEALLMVGRGREARAVLDRGASVGLAGAAVVALRTQIDHSELYQRALEHHKSGQLTEAEQIYTAILADDPVHVDSLHMTGVLAYQTDRSDLAVELIGQAIQIRRDVAAFHANLGNALLEIGRTADATNAYEQAVSLQPVFPDAQIRLGILYQDGGNLDGAVTHYRSVIDAGVHLAAAYNNTGVILLKQSKPHEAIPYFEATLRENADHPEARNNLGNALREIGEFDSAIPHYREALRLRPEYVDAVNNLATTLQLTGKIDEAITAYRTALALDPRHTMTRNNLLMLLGYAPDTPPSALADEARLFDAFIAAPLLRTRALTNNVDPERRLRIGYVSGDFREHAVNYFFEPLLTHHDRERFEIFAYSMTYAEDAASDRIKANVHCWRNIRPLADDAVADLIEADAIDILIDMSGHVADNRLLVFARKPAPVQATWLGFMGTTGLTAIDYRISDGHIDPVGMTERFNVEALWRLPGAFCCYQAPKRDIAAIGHPPADDNGYVTFGCFNNFVKVNDQVLRSWAGILARIPDARLLLEIVGIDGETFLRETEARLTRLGLPLDRVILEPRRRENQFVLYNKVDIALDPFPFNGGTTTMDALWMGVPVVTLAGQYCAARMGVTILANAGLPELIASTEDEYVDIAASLAEDSSLLRNTRHDLRKRLTESRMMNHAAFARDMEDAYRGMWRMWCEQQTQAARRFA